MSAILCGNVQEKCRTPFPGPHFVRACAVETHMDISQEPFCVEIYSENAGPRVNTSIEHRALTLTVPLHCGHTVRGKTKPCLCPRLGKTHVGHLSHEHCTPQRI